MANKIEIFENTLLKLLVRRGMNADREKIVLSEGELGYTTDTKRLYIGDGQTLGGLVVGGSKFLGSANVVTTFAGATPGDLAFSLDTDKLYSFKGGTYTDINNWDVVGGVYEPGNSTISINSLNNVTVGTISASNITRDIVSNGNIVLNNTNRISLSNDIQIDSIRGLGSSYLSLPSNLRINSVSYEMPGPGIADGSYLRSDNQGKLTWTPYIDVDSTYFVYNTAGIIPVGSIMPFVSSGSGAPNGWLQCNGQSVLGSSFPELSAVIGTTFGGNGTNFNVPNLTNRALYGANGSLNTSTLYSVSTGTNSMLSAAGALYIIKARPDRVVDVRMTINTPLCATVNGVQAGSNFNPLTGTVSIGVQTTNLTSTTTILGGFVADEYGRVVRTLNDGAPPDVYTGPGTRPIYNSNTSPIAFFRTPAYILNQPYSVNPSSSIFVISAFPFITDNTGARVGGGTFYSVPPTAKNLIVDASILKDGPDTVNRARVIASAPNTSLLEPVGAVDTLGVNEFLVSVSRSAGLGDIIQGGNQCFIPLSASSNGHLTAAFRVSPSSNDAYWVRVVGYTL